MDFKDLEKIANRHVQKTTDSKQAQFEKVFNKGFALLKQAQLEGFKIEKTLQSCCHLLIDAVTLNRKDIRSFLALAYLFTILEDFNTAHEYTYAALKVDQGNPEIAKFLKEINAFKKEVQQRSLLAHDKPLQIDIPVSPWVSEKQAKVPDYEALYTEIEAFILDKLKGLFSSQNTQVEPTVDRNRLKLIEQSFQNLNQVIAYIEQQLNIIKQGLDISKLREKIAPLKVLEERYSQTLISSKRLMEINDTIELWSFKTKKQVQVVNQKLTMSALTYGRVDVDRMMDGCDIVADELDKLSEAENIDISLVEGSYEKLLTLVDSLNGMVEDAPMVESNHKKLADIID